MLERGLLADFDAAAKQEIAHLPQHAPLDGLSKDLRALLWSSIDNRESHDLDPIEGGRIPDIYEAELEGRRDF